MSLDLFNLHALFDMAGKIIYTPEIPLSSKYIGAAGHVKYNGSIVLLEATYQDIMLTIRSMELIAKGSHSFSIF